MATFGAKLLDTLNKVINYIYFLFFYVMVG